MITVISKRLNLKIELLSFNSNTETKAADTPNKRIKVVVKNASMIENGKVTKTNFFTNDSNLKTQADEELADLNDSMISARVDPEEWYQEVERVK